MKAPLNVLVMGMHRSGTSAVAGALKAAGFSPGEGGASMSATLENPTGYGERRDLLDLDERLLRELGWTWDAPAAEPLGSPPALLSLVEQGRDMVEQRLAPRAPWLLKDPRLSLLLPWWRQILLDRFAAVVVVRSAEEIAWSLSVRNGFPFPLGLALVGAYQRHLAKGLEGLPVVVVDYVSLMEDAPAVVASLLDGLERLGAGSSFDHRAAVASIDPLLRRATHPPSVTDADSTRWLIERLRRGWPSDAVTTLERSNLKADPPDAWETALIDSQRSVRSEQERAAAARSEADAALAEVRKARGRLADFRREAARADAEAAKAEAAARRTIAGATGRDPDESPSRPADANPLFDGDWYITTYPDVRASGMDPSLHYQRFGVDEGRDPNPYFDVDWYLSLYPHVRESGEDPLDHYLRQGAAESLDPSPLFDSAWYLSQNPDVAASGINPLLHYLLRGEREGRTPRPDAEAKQAAWKPTRHDGADVEHLQRLILELVPSDAGVAIATDGDAEAAAIVGVKAQAFPSMRGGNAAASRSDTAAVAHLESMRAGGTGYFVADRSSRLLMTLPRLAWHLETRYVQCSPAAEQTLVYDLREIAAGQSGSYSAQVRRIVDEFRDRFDREPVILACGDRLELARAAPQCEVFSPPPSTDDRLPYLDASVDLIVVRASHGASTVDAERVASAGVLTVTGEGDERRISMTWRPDRPEPRLPSASIVIPTYNGLHLMESCLRTLSETIPADVDVEIVVVDDASTDGSRDALARIIGQHQGVSLILNDENLGFIGSVNRGAETATRDFLILLNNDTILLPDWLSPLLRTFRSRPDAGAVGGKLVYPDGRLQEAGGIIFSDASAANYGSGDSDPDAPQYSYLREVDYVSGALLATPMGVFRDLGGLDPIYGFGYYDDADYCFKLRAAGLRAYFQPESAIVHLEGQTSGTDTSQGPKRSQVKNREIFMERWRDDLQRQAPPPEAWDRRTLYALADRGAA